MYKHRPRKSTRIKRGMVMGEESYSPYSNVPVSSKISAHGGIITVSCGPVQVVVGKTKPVEANEVKVGSAMLWTVSKKSLNNIIQEEKDSLWEDNNLLIKRLRENQLDKSLV